MRGDLFFGADEFEPFQSCGDTRCDGRLGVLLLHPDDFSHTSQPHGHSLSAGGQRDHEFDRLADVNLDVGCEEHAARTQITSLANFADQLRARANKLKRELEVIPLIFSLVSQGHTSL